jgi:DNA-binding response OmpR family regulator
MARIAVVEDDPDLFRLVRVTLARRGHEVIGYPDGATAVEGIPKGNFDLVLSDVQMPHLDGLALVRVLRAVYDASRLPIILLSARADEAHILAGYEAGANDYLLKPFAPALLCAKIATLLRHHPRLDEKTRRLPLPPGQLRPPFDVAGFHADSVLGEGGFSVVYRATRVSDGREVALKVMRPAAVQDDEALLRYFREVATLEQVHSPHVVTILDSGQEEGRYYIAMELVEGRSSRELLEQDGPLALDQIAQLGRDLAKGLHAMHERGLVHRDIKPANVLVRSDGSGVLVDLGLAKSSTDDNLTRTSELMGTADFVAPEVIEGDPASVASDVYGLGVTLYQVLTGVAPFHQESPYQTLRRIVSGEPALPVDQVRPGVDPVLVNLIATCMDRSPERRPQSLLELSRAFGRVLETAPECCK